MSLEKEIYSQLELSRLWLLESGKLKKSEPISSAELSQLSTYFELLERWSKKMDLVAPATSGQLIERHLVDCYLAYLLIKNQLGKFSSCLDVGSGAGLPGIVFAILEPKANFVLCEPREKRQIFLKEASATLPNVEVLGLRLEDVAKTNKYDLITSRALGLESSFDSLAKPLLLKPGAICQLLGPSWNGEGRAEPVSILNYSLYLGGPERKLVFWGSWE